MNIGGGGETIHLSFGPAANAVTSHLCNLEGLACTTTAPDGDDDTSSSPICDPYITHGVHQETWTPRVLFVDGSNGFTPWAGRFGSNDGGDSCDGSNGVNQQNVSSWTGQIEVHSASTLPTSANGTGSAQKVSQNASLNSNDFHYFNTINSNNIFSTPSSIEMTTPQTTLQNTPHNFQTLSTQMASTSSQYSRYNTSRYKSNSAYMHSSYNREASRMNTNNGRHMVWDDEEEEEEEEQDPYYSSEEYQYMKREKERQLWNVQEEDLHDQLQDAWDSFANGDVSTFTAIHQAQDIDTTTTTSSTQGEVQEDETKVSSESLTSKKSNLSLLQWMDYFMPPHPPTSWYTAPLPFPFTPTSSSNSTNSNTTPPSSQSIFDSYYCGHQSKSPNTCLDHKTSNFDSEWRNNVISEKIRKYMESCDRISGFHVMIDSDRNFFGGLAHSVLEELHDECRSAVKFSTLVQDGNAFCDNVGNITTNVEEDSSYWRTEHKVVESFRSHLNSGLTFHGITENSDLTLPLSLSQCWNSIMLPSSTINNDATTANSNNSHTSTTRSLFEASSIAALAMENATLPYRIARSSSLGPQPQSKIGVLSGFFQGSGQAGPNSNYPTADTLSFHEFISILRPSNQHVLLDLSGLTQTPFRENGMDETRGNLEFYQRLKQGTSIERRQFEEERNRQTSPWFRKSRPRDVDPGLWMEDGPNGGMLSSFSPMCGNAPTIRSSHTHFAVSTAIRPSILPAQDPLDIYTTLLMEGMNIRFRPQRSIGTVLKQSFSSMVNSRGYGAGCYWNSIVGMKKGSISAPIMTVLGNTTRSYYHLKSTSSNLKAALSRKYIGYMSRDVMAGICPESEDCSEALEKCLDYRDVYEPMFEGDDEEGMYFDDNED